MCIRGAARCGGKAGGLPEARLSSLSCPLPGLRVTSPNCSHQKTEFLPVPPPRRVGRPKSRASREDSVQNVQNRGQRGWRFSEKGAAPHAARAPRSATSGTCASFALTILWFSRGFQKGAHLPPDTRRFLSFSSRETGMLHQWERNCQEWSVPSPSVAVPSGLGGDVSPYPGISDMPRPCAGLRLPPRGSADTGREGSPQTGARPRWAYSRYSPTSRSLVSSTVPAGWNLVRQAGRVWLTSAQLVLYTK